MIARPRDHVMPLELPALAEAVATWTDAHPHVWRAVVFGSRVRGDHRPDSDLDVLLQPPPGGISRESMTWWLRARKSQGAAFASLREAIRPVDLHLAQGHDDPARAWVDLATLDPHNVVLCLGKVVCLWTSRKATL